MIDLYTAVWFLWFPISAMFPSHIQRGRSGVHKRTKSWQEL